MIVFHWGTSVTWTWVWIDCKSSSSSFLSYCPLAELAKASPLASTFFHEELLNAASISAVGLRALTLLSTSLALYSIAGSLELATRTPLGISVVARLTSVSKAFPDLSRFLASWVFDQASSC